MTDRELYQAAKEAYYNGTPIMEDFEFDELERKLGLENKSYVGSKHNPSYTIRHPYIMGSLSKVQIKDKGGINWTFFLSQIEKFIYRNGWAPLIITPKFDGCSFELYAKNNRIQSISTRGDGEYGKDISKHLSHFFQNSAWNIGGEFTLRGEVLIDKYLFVQKYSDYTNPRTFVSGLLNRDYDETDAIFLSMIQDLSIVIYDVRTFDGTWRDRDWAAYIGQLDYLPEFFLTRTEQLDARMFEAIYNTFSDYRRTCPFALDGIVFKPQSPYRESNGIDARPKDCVAVKFLPNLQETTIRDIEWSISKTNELRPVIITDPVYMDGKKITRASAHNYGYLLEHKLSVGCKVILSLAGDIIPFIYQVTNTDEFDENKLCLPLNKSYLDGCHLYIQLTPRETRLQKFLQSASTLSIPSIGPAAARAIFEELDEKLELTNILECTPSQIEMVLGGKIGSNAATEFSKFLKSITLKDIIMSCTFDACGEKVSEIVAQHILTGDADFEHLAEKAYSWCLNPESEEYALVMNLVGKLGLSLKDFKVEDHSTQIPVILTGEPNNYKTKNDFLAQHPEYRLTNSWKEVQIVFTNDPESKTGKMKKALEKGIEIRVY